MKLHIVRPQYTKSVEYRKDIYSMEHTVVIDTEDFCDNLLATCNYVETEARDICDLLENFIRRQML